MTGKGLTNAEIADRLWQFAVLLELAETNAFAVRAYARAAELIRSTPAPVAELVRAGRVRELRGIGSGIAGKLEELVETGDIAELGELEARVPVELVGYGRMLGLTTQRVLAIVDALGVRSAVDLRDAVASGRLRDVPGIGPVTESRIRAALEREPRAPRGLTLNRSLPLARALATQLGGEVAGPARRFCELSYELAVVCATDDPRALVARFERLPQIVAVLERRERRAVALTVEGVPVTLVVAAPASFGTELRPGHRVGGVRRGARAVAGRRGRGRSSSRACAFPIALPSFVRLPAPLRLPVSSSARTFAAISTVTRPGRTAGPRSRTWRSLPGHVGTSTWRSATTRRTCEWFRV